MCAVAMLFYHMGCVILHANRPQESTAIRSTVSARLLSYQRDLYHATRHTREICGIISVERSEAVLFHAVQPLFVAGQVFSSQKEEQRAVADMLVRIERDVGYSTSFFVQKLQEDWTAALNFECTAPC
ncbi:hypothetical protein F5Y16DRAFT_187700 [Xylariaceae sp. FL0255]|nr:hypothetical protein F5Y16DRAFT_187700 [Xylariaceae sp. FL0255]